MPAHMESLSTDRTQLLTGGVGGSSRANTTTGNAITTSRITTTTTTTATSSSNNSHDNNSGEQRVSQQLNAHEELLEYGSQEEDAMMNEMISKHRTELTELQKFIGRTINTDDEDDDLLFPADDMEDSIPNTPPPPPPPSSGGGYHDESYDDLASPDGYHTPRPVRSKTAERLLELSRTEEALRNDRMRLAELSDVRNEKLGREVIKRWNPQAKVVHTTRDDRTFNHVGGRMSPTLRARTPGTASPRTSAKILGYSKDFVQQALDFNGHDMDDDDVALGGGVQSPTTRGLHASLRFAESGGGEDDFRGRKSQLELRTYVKQMEETIAQLVQQKDELLRNQAEFDKHASGIFPSLEHLNHQLSQIVQGKMANSQVNIKVRTELMAGCRNCWIWTPRRLITVLVSCLCRRTYLMRSEYRARSSMSSSRRPSAGTTTQTCWSKAA